MGRFRDMDKHLDTDTTQWYWPQNSCLLLLGISAAQLWVSTWNNTEAAVRYWAKMLLPQRMDTSATQAYNTVPWSLPLCRDGAGARGHRRIHGTLGSGTCPHQVCTPVEDPLPILPSGIHVGITHRSIQTPHLLLILRRAISRSIWPEEQGEGARAARPNSSWSLPCRFCCAYSALKHLCFIWL